jgi:hypothetical protein
MKWIALDFVSLDRGIQKTEVKRCVMANEYGSVTAGAFELSPNDAEYISQCLTLANRSSERVVDLNPCELERRRLNVRARKRVNVMEDLLSRSERPFLIELHDDCANLEDGVSLGVKPPGFEVNHHG